MRRHVTPYWTGSGGNAAVEFALIVPAFTLLIFALVHLCLLGYANMSLHWDVEAAARCALVSQRYGTPPSGDPSVNCKSISLTRSYAQNIYKGPIAAPTFTPSFSSSSGNNCMQVAASGSYKINAGIASMTVPLTAMACFPTTSTSWS